MNNDVAGYLLITPYPGCGQNLPNSLVGYANIEHLVKLENGSYLAWVQASNDEVFMKLARRIFELPAVKDLQSLRGTEINLGQSNPNLRQAQEKMFLEEKE